jgi:hypothetical protein
LTVGNAEKLKLKKYLEAKIAKILNFVGKTNSKGKIL